MIFVSGQVFCMLTIEENSFYFRHYEPIKIIHHTFAYIQVVSKINKRT